MPIVRKSNADRHIQRLEQKIEIVKEALTGREPSMNLWNIYASNESDYSRDFRHVNKPELLTALENAETVINELKNMAILEARTLHAGG